MSKKNNDSAASSSPSSRLQGKVAIVTGASRGIGESIAERFAAEGAAVVVASRKLEGLEPVAARIQEAGGQAAAIACHTGKEDQVRALVAQAVERFGKVDILVNNAATNPHFGPMLSIEQGAFDKTFEVNVRGYFLTAREVVAHFQAEGREGGSAGGSIVNIASVVGTMGAPFQGVYAMTKAAVISMTKTLAIELGGAGIRVNAIAPGLIETRFSQALIQNDAIRELVVQRTALKRVGQPLEIAGAALFLASDDAAYTTGEVLTVDGGWTVS